VRRTHRSPCDLGLRLGRPVSLDGALEGGTRFTFVNDGIQSALEQAFAAAMGKDVRIGGGAATVSQYLKAGLIDDLHLVLVPILKGMRGSGVVVVGLGMAVLGAYGVVVNLLDLDFSRLLGAYVGIFAVVSVIFGRWMFRDQIPVSTWIGLAIILAGSMVIHVGRAT
jgi:drug/metabolite transporter superfamily protein YnfA